jgi:GntR family transcriptional regulator
MKRFGPASRVFMARTSKNGNAKNGNGLPAYQRIQNVIRERIATGELTTGDVVESERELARIHGVSLMTARHALSSLEQEGLVERRRGAGTFIAAPKIHFNKLTSYTEQMASRGLSTSAKVLVSKIIDTDQEICARLGLPPMSRLVKIQRLRLAAGEPFAHETCYLAAAEFQGLVSAALGRESLFSILQRDYGLELAHADEEVDATAADPGTADLLGIPRKSPLLRIRQVIFSTKGKAVIYALCLYRSDRHNLTIRRYR